MTNLKREQNIQEAMELIEQAQQLVDEALENTNNNAHYKGYGKYGFKQLLGEGNRYDGSLPKILEDIENQDLYSLTDDD